MKSRFLAMLIVVVMAFVMCATALAEQVTASRSEQKFYYDASGNRLTNATDLSGNAVVELKKWVEQATDSSGAPLENEFLITL